MSESFTDPLIAAAAKLDPSVAALAQDPFVDDPSFRCLFASESHPALNGEVVMRYPTMGDMLEIEALSTRGKPFSEIVATLQVLVERAPLSWYQPAKAGAKPSLALGRVPYCPELFALYTDFIAWRDSFRGPRSGGATPASV